MKKYEYAFFTYDDLHLCEALDNCNEWGEEGWELVSHSICCDSGIIEQCNIYHYFYFKREII